MADRTPPPADCQDNAGCALYFCPTSGEVECPQHGGFDVCCNAAEWHRRIPAPVPPAAPWQSPAHTTDAHPDGYGWPPFGDAALLEAYERGVAAGRSAAAADIRQKINDWRPQANTSLYALDVLSYAAEIAEGNTDA